MKKNTLQDLRDHLFEQLEELRDPETKLDVKRAELVCNVADKIIASAIAEVKFLQVTGHDPKDPQFFGQPQLTDGRGSTGDRPITFSSVRRTNGGAS